MNNEVLGRALSQAVERTLSVTDLIRVAEQLKLGGQVGAVDAIYSVWIQHNGDNPLLYAVLFNYAVILSDAGKLTVAKECLERAIQLNAEFMPLYINLGRVLERLGSIGDAVACWSKAVEKLAAVNGAAVHHKTTALNQMARTLEAVTKDELAEEMLRQSLDLVPGQKEVAQHFLAARQRQCKWPVIEPTDRVSTRQLLAGLSPLSVAAHTDDPLFQLGLAHTYNKSDVGRPRGVMFDWPAAVAHDGPLKVGYLSSDLREHAVGHLVSEIFALHDRAKVEVFAYYSGPPGSGPMHDHFKATCDHWLDVTQVDDETAARRMAEDGIQILIDLNGYTREGRTKLIAHRPAPVIVNWLGYPGTTASPYHHYVVADDFIIPPDHELYYSEQVLRLPCYQPNNRHRIVADKAFTRAELGLPETGVVFCCFNGTHKITRFTFDRWLEIIEGVPGSVLWLLTGSEATNARLKDYAAAKGIDPERVVFAGKMKNAEHLARYRQADLFLDTTPYGAHTTCSDALWVGVPVLTYAGRSFASRVCGSLVASAGLPELITTDAKDFVATAIALGRDPDRLAGLRTKLAAGRDTCVLFDTPLLVRELERLYGDMWRAFREDRLPVPDLANLDEYFDVGLELEHEAVEMQTRADYLDLWREALDLRDRFRPLAADMRLMRRDRPAAAGAVPRLQRKKA